MEQRHASFNDTVANSMYGGAQTSSNNPWRMLPSLLRLLLLRMHRLLQHLRRLLQHLRRLLNPQDPLPPGGLPAGWSMEQWAYYGQQYLDQINQH